jgi:hypothetical protein
MARRDDALRRLLVSGRADSALVRVVPRGESAPEDELLRSLYGGILGHYSGAYLSSSGAFQRAADLADDRYTKRVSRAALSLVTNDKALPYEPGETERLLIHYYSALNFLRQSDSEGAAVEARRLSALLEREDSPRDSTLYGWLRYFSGAVFEAAGERNDADVADRNAEALQGPRGIGGETPRGAAELGGGLVDYTGGDRDSEFGEVVVLVEEGFVAHRVEQAIVMPLYAFEMDRLSGGETGSRLGAAGALTTRVVAQALLESGSRDSYYGPPPRTLKVPPLPREVVLRECAEVTAVKAAADNPEDRGDRSDPPKKPSKQPPKKPAKQPSREPAKQPLRAPVAGPGTLSSGAGLPRGTMRPAVRSKAPRTPARKTCADLRNPYLLKLAWPVFRQERVPAYGVRVVAAGVTDPLVMEPLEGRPIQLRTDLSRAVIGDFDQERGAILARIILRGVTKAMVTRSVEKAPGDDAEALGWLLGALVNVGTALLEQADTRSWQLLPNQIRLIRLRLPPGERALALELDGAGGEPRRVELGTVRVQPGTLEFVSARVWP